MVLVREGGIACERRGVVTVQLVTREENDKEQHAGYPLLLLSLPFPTLSAM